MSRPTAEPRDERAAAVSRTATPALAEPVAAAKPPRQLPFMSSALACPAQLPIGPCTFVGRKQALANASSVIGLTRRMKIPLIISGPIGVGKTAFALRLADDLAAEFPDGQIYADLSTCGVGAPSPDEIMRGVLRALGVPDHHLPDNQMQRIGLYRSLLARRRLFVLLEGACHEGQVRPLLGQYAHTQVVVTSSARLLGLDGMHRIELDALAREESVALLARLIGAERVLAEGAAADTVAARCCDLPLAINIMGRKIAARPGWTIQHAAALLADADHQLDCLSVGDVNVRDRLAAAYRLLPNICRRAIQKLGHTGAEGVTAGSLAAAMGISSAAADDLLESLVDAGLLTRADARGRYGMSVLVGAFAASTKRDATYLAVPLPTAIMGDHAIHA